MSIILGLDVSTSCTGVCIIDSNVRPDASGRHVLHLYAVTFGKEGALQACSTLWEKADRIKQSFEKIANDLALGDSSVHFDNVVSYPAGTKIERIVLEEPLMGFRPGMSSAQTITQLMRFNGIVSYLAREAFHVEPEYVGSSHARKLCGIKLSQTKIGGPQKEQVFKHMAEHDLKHVHWPVKKNGATVDWSRDACDAYVIARAAMVNGGPFIVVKKPRKAKKSKDEE